MVMVVGDMVDITTFTELLLGTVLGFQFPAVFQLPSPASPVQNVWACSMVVDMMIIPTTNSNDKVTFLLMHSSTAVYVIGVDICVLPFTFHAKEGFNTMALDRTFQGFDKQCFTMNRLRRHSPDAPHADKNAQYTLPC